MAVRKTTTSYRSSKSRENLQSPKGVLLPPAQPSAAALLDPAELSSPSSQLLSLMWVLTTYSPHPIPSVGKKNHRITMKIPCHGPPFSTRPGETHLSWQPAAGRPVWLKVWVPETGVRPQVIARVPAASCCRGWVFVPGRVSMWCD